MERGREGGGGGDGMGWEEEDPLISLVKRRVGEGVLEEKEEEKREEKKRGTNKTHLEISRNFDDRSILSEQIESPFPMVGTVA